MVDASAEGGNGAKNRPSTRRVVGVLLLLVAPALALGSEFAARRDAHEAERLLAAIAQKGDTVGRSSAAYHGAYAQQALQSRWDLTGHALLGTVGTIAGLALLMPRRRRAG